MPLFWYVDDANIQLSELLKTFEICNLSFAVRLIYVHKTDKTCLADVKYVSLICTQRKLVSCFVSQVLGNSAKKCQYIYKKCQKGWISLNWFTYPYTLRDSVNRFPLLWFFLPIFLALFVIHVLNICLLFVWCCCTRSLTKVCISNRQTAQLSRVVHFIRIQY